MKRTFITIALALLIAACASAQHLSVVYVEGAVAVKKGQTWQELAPGDSVLATASVRLGTASYLEIGDGPQTISISQPGTYALGALIAQKTRMQSAGVGSALAGKLATLFSAPTHQGAVLGVRGAKVTDNGGTSWVTSEAAIYVDSGKQYIEAGNYPKAIEQLKQAVDDASDAELPETRYYLAYAYALAGDTRDALKQIRGVKPSEIASAADLVVLKGKLLLDTNAFRQDIDWLGSNAALIGADSDRAPLYYLLLGLSFRGAGNAVSARSNFQKVVSLAGKSELGKTAEKLLRQQ